MTKIPNNVEFSDAVVSPLGVTTAASCLYGEQLLDHKLPQSQSGNGKTLLIRSASRSIGCCGLRLALAAGYEVFAIASSRNHESLRSVGAAGCFDYRDEDLIVTVVDAMQGKDIVGALDAISTDDTLNKLCELLSQRGSRESIASVMPGAEAKGQLGAIARTNFVNEAFNTRIDRCTWRDFLEPALANGSVQYKPDGEVFGHGSESVQRALNQLAAGVSAKKLVVTL